MLIPLEYTRLDALIDVMFTTARDVESAVDSEKQTDSDDTGEKSNWEFTDPALMQEKRALIINAFAKQHNVRLIRRSRALYWNAEHSFRAVCTVSKRYARSDTRYWYAYHPQWDDFLGEVQDSYFILGCMDLEVAFAIPVNILRKHLEELNVTSREDETSYWHIKILEQNLKTYFLQMPKSGNHLPLSQYTFRLTQ